MLPSVQELKNRVAHEVDRLREAMVRIARDIHANPEVGFQEHRAFKILTEFLEVHEFRVRRNVAGMDTAFVAISCGAAERPLVALLAEYDALPGMGHACGHNLIGAASVGAAAALRGVLPGLSGSVAVLGCPAEEAGVDGAGGKVRLIEEGYFKQVDAAMIFHPTPCTTVGGETSALIGLELAFRGRAAHAAGNPWDGRNALDAVLQTFHSINALRQHLRDDVRVHGVITHGGEAPNIVPEYAAARFFVRANCGDHLREVVKRVERCAEGAALATGTEVEIKTFCNFYDAMKCNSVIAAILEGNLKLVGLKVEGRKKGKGSTDFGNVTRAVPACELAIRLGDGIVPHTREFSQAANSEEGYSIMLLGAKVLAFSVIDLLCCPGLLDRMMEQYQAGRS